eukprot:364602-Chlamydomonas_euryale.AAC.11
MWAGGDPFRNRRSGTRRRGPGPGGGKRGSEAHPTPPPHKPSVFLYSAGPPFPSRHCMQSGWSLGLPALTQPATVSFRRPPTRPPAAQTSGLGRVRRLLRAQKRGPWHIGACIAQTEGPRLRAWALGSGGGLLWVTPLPPPSGQRLLAGAARVRRRDDGRGGIGGHAARLRGRAALRGCQGRQKTLPVSDEVAGTARASF